MGTLISMFFDEPTLAQTLRSGNGASLGILEKPDDPEEAASLQRILEAGARQETDDPSADIYAILWLCRLRCEFAGEIDHFRYDHEDFKELFALQFGDTESPLKLPVEEEWGLPAVNHWPIEDIMRLAEEMGMVDLSERPEYTHEMFMSVRTWVTAARDKGLGLFICTEG
jgi:hypothetical protein